LQRLLEEALENARQTQVRLSTQVTSLQNALKQTEEEAAVREDELRSEINSMQMRVQMAEANRYSGDMEAEEGRDATLPLLEQIDALQREYHQAQRLWDTAHVRSQQHVSQLEADNAQHVSRLHQLEHDKSTLEETVAQLTTQVQQLQQEQVTTLAKLEAHRELVARNNEAITDYERKLLAQRTDYEVEVSDLKTRLQEHVDAKEVGEMEAQLSLSSFIHVEEPVKERPKHERRTSTAADVQELMSRIGGLQAKLDMTTQAKGN
jgi:chromosome segregation ATPase